MNELNHQVTADVNGVGESLTPGAATRERIKSLFKEQYHNRLNAKYDAAQTTPENEIHWGMADNLSANAALSRDVRRKLVTRSRYEAENSSFYAGALQDDANAAIGPGPNKRFFFGLGDEIDSSARHLFKSHARLIHLAQKLRLIRQAMMRDGEVFVTRFNNFQLPVDLPQHDLAVIECDRVTAPYEAFSDPDNIDGVLLDRNGVPVQYQVLDRHPGDIDPYLQGEFGAYTPYSAADVIHYAHLTRPGQIRGLPVVTPCLNLFAQFRRFKLAVLTAAETAANIAAMLKLDTTIVSEMVAGSAGSSSLILEDDELFEIVRGAMPALPPGYSLEQMKAEQPTTTLDMFEKTLLREIARPFGQTYSVMAGDSSDSNMSSGNLDVRRWWDFIEPERGTFDEVVLDRHTAWWWEDQRRIPSSRSSNSLPLSARLIDRPRNRTTWSTRFKHNDPAKVAKADEVYHSLGLLTDEAYLESHNLDIDETYENLAEQVRRRDSLGINVVGPGPKAIPAEPQDSGDQPQENDGEDSDDS